MAFVPTNAEFRRMFSIPREPATQVGPGQHFELEVPEGRSVLVTDVYIENMGGGTSALYILEQKGPQTFELRYTFRTAADQVTIINFTTGLKLGDLAPIAGSIRFSNDMSSQAAILPRVNGIILPQDV
jgi:hypothetical protein